MTDIMDLRERTRSPRTVQPLIYIPVSHLFHLSTHLFNLASLAQKAMLMAHHTLLCSVPISIVYKSEVSDLQF